MKNKQILFYYCFLIALFITVSGILSSQNSSQLLFQLLFLPVTLYFCYSVLVQIIDKKTSLLPSPKINRRAIIITSVFFIFLFVMSFLAVVKKPINNKKTAPKIVLTPSPKSEKFSYVILKEEFKTDKINIRQIPSTSGKIVSTMESKRQYQIVAKQDSWYQILIDSKSRGFVSDKFVEIKQ